MNRDLDLSTATAAANPYLRIVDRKQYELSNHLGNVLTAVSDRRIGKDVFTYTPAAFGFYTFSSTFNDYVYTPGTGTHNKVSDTDNTIDYYIADVISAVDYGVWGDELINRSFFSGNNRYGFNGKEKDDEVKGSGNSYDFGARIYDPRLGRFLSIDPRWNEYPHMSVYLFAADNPIYFIDANGEGPVPVTVQTNAGNITVNKPLQTYTLNELLEELRKPLQPKPPTWKLPRIPKVILAPVLTAVFVLIPGNRTRVEQGACCMNSICSSVTPKCDKAKALAVINNPSSLRIFTTDPSTLPDFYIDQVQRRLLDGTADINDMKYKGEVLLRKGANALGKVGECFTKGTLILTEKGKRPIEEVKKGDKVWTYDETKGKIILCEVVNTFERTTSNLIEITVNGKKITTTPEHPFYVNGFWVRAGDLTSGDFLTTFDSTAARIERVERIDTTIIQIFNFEVKGAHTYYVSSEAVLVHNICYEPFKLDVNGNKRSVYRGGNTFTVKPGEVKLTADGLVKKDGRGVSLDIESTNLERFGDVYEIIYLPDGLQVLQKGARLDHYEILPKEDMPLDEYQKLLDQIEIIKVDKK